MKLTNNIFWCGLVTALLQTVIQAEEVKVVPLADKPPVMDGNLNDACWEKALKFENMISATDLKTPEPAEFLTTTLLLCDEEWLYVGVTRRNCDVDIDAQDKGGRDNIWRLDYVEVFINTVASDLDNYYQFSINPYGMLGDLRLIGPNAVSRKESMLWDAGWEGKCKFDTANKQWIIEEKIPLAALDFSQVQDGKIGINIARYSHRDKGSYSFTGYFHAPKLMIPIKLACDTSWRKLELDNTITLSSHGLGQNTAAMKVTNQGQKSEYTVRILCGEGARENLKASELKSVKLAPKTPTEVKADFTLNEGAEPKSVILQVLDEKRVAGEVAQIFKMTPTIGGKLSCVSYSTDEEFARADLALNLSPVTLQTTRLKACITDPAGGNSTAEIVVDKLAAEQKLYLPLKNVKPGKQLVRVQLVNRENQELAKLDLPLEITESLFK